MTFDPLSRGTMPLPRKSGGASLEMRKGIFLMRLRGEYEEMGRQQAELVSGLIDDYILSYYEGFLEKIIMHTEVAHISRSLPKALSNLIYSVFIRLNAKRIGPQMDGFMKGLLEGLRIDPRRAARLALFPDILHYLAGKGLAPMAAPGCSAFVARGAATKDGKLIVGRNFDFFGSGVWNDFQTVTVFHPKDAMSSMWVGALGLPVGGFGLNAAGISVMPFTKFCSDVSFTGTPVFSICADILAKAESVEDAIRMITSCKRIGALTLLVVDSKTRDAAAVGFTANHVEIVRPEDDFLVRTNHYVTPELRKYQVAPSAWVRHSASRFNRITALVREKHGSLTSGDAPAIMSDCIDDFEGRKRVVGDIVAAANNAMTLVYAPDDDAIHIAQGPFPVGHADVYNGFKLSALLEGSDDCDAHDLQGANQLNEKEKAAVDQYQRAYSELLDRYDVHRAIYHLRRAVEILPDEPIFHRCAGLLLMKEGRPIDALPHMQRNAAVNYKENKVKAEALLWVGRCFDLAGRRDQAVLFYRQSMERNDNEMTPPARKHINTPFRQKEMNAVDVELIIGSPICKYS